MRPGAIFGPVDAEVAAAAAFLFFRSNRLIIRILLLHTTCACAAQRANPVVSSKLVGIGRTRWRTRGRCMRSAAEAVEHSSAFSNGGEAASEAVSGARARERLNSFLSWFRRSALLFMDRWGGRPQLVTDRGKTRQDSPRRRLQSQDSPRLAKTLLQSTVCCLVMLTRRLCVGATHRTTPDHAGDTRPTTAIHTNSSYS